MSSSLTLCPAELPCERASLRRRVDRRGRPVEEDPECPLSLLHLWETEGGECLSWTNQPVRFSQALDVKVIQNVQCCNSTLIKNHKRTGAGAGRQNKAEGAHSSFVTAAHTLSLNPCVSVSTCVFC